MINMAQPALSHSGWGRQIWRKIHTTVRITHHAMPNTFPRSVGRGCNQWSSYQTSGSTQKSKHFPIGETGADSDRFQTCSGKGQHISWSITFAARFNL